MKRVVIVESPTKAKTIRKFLPDGYVVDSSYGHIRDLPASAAEIPAKFKKMKWANLGINTDDGYEPLYVISAEKKKVVSRLKELTEKADELILATDEDREGEGIAWHIQEVLKPNIPVKRMVFHEITQEAIKSALQNFRQIDMNLVDAQETRRVLDRLAGYTVSPLLWKKIAPGLSAGRVQSVAVELIVQRERDRMRFRSGSYWDLKAHLLPNGAKTTFTAELTELNGKRLATGKDFDEGTGKLSKPQNVVLLDEAKASALRKELLTAAWSVLSVESNTQLRQPFAPFTTSTLQQEANRKFGMSAKDTMRTAQKLYEEGFITYMRTDSTNLSAQAISASRSAVESMYGKEYLSDQVRTYSTKAKGAQEAHEAIRPAGSAFKLPASSGLSGRELKLYDLIWKRTIATQMAPARISFTTAVITAQAATDVAQFKATGKEILFPGFFRAYVEGSDDPAAELEDQDKPLPKLAAKDPLSCSKMDALEHATKPPARYTEASLVKELEKEGVGRPSTYAAIIERIQDIKYVVKEGNAMAPTFTAFAVMDLLEKHFPDMVDIQFTSEMENRLDMIANGKEDRVKYLDGYYGGEAGLRSRVDRQDSQIVPAEAKKLDLPIDGLDGVDILIGKFGPYVQFQDNGEAKKVSLPVSMLPGELTMEGIRSLVGRAEEGPQSLGTYPPTGEDVYVMDGRFGPYVQVGEVSDDNKKPKRASLLKGQKPEDMTLELALKLLELPRSLGMHPESGKEVKASVGRFGPYVVHDGTFKSLAKSDDVLTIDMARAVALLAEPKTGGRGKGAGAALPAKELGVGPDQKTPIQVLAGRYGPYIKYGKSNISLKKGSNPDTLTLEEALGYIAEKAKA
jgi:DNA topoisomerase-1